MKRVASILLCILMVGLSCFAAAEGSSADTVIYGQIITMDEANPTAEAVAVADGAIVFVGSREEAEQYIGAGTKVYDYHGNYVYPGFVDGHSHIGLQATLENDSITFPTTTTLRENAELMKQFIEENPGLEIYKGCGFLYMESDPDPLTHEVIDRYASDEVPIIWTDKGCHTALLNQKAIDYFHIQDWVEIYGTDGVKVDENGVPTGYLVETPRFDLFEKIPLDKETLKNFVIAKQTTCIAQGYTAITDAAVTETDILPVCSAYRELAEENKLKLKVRALYEISEVSQDPIADVKRAAELAKEYENEYFSITGVKIFLDGVSEAHTTWTLEPYTAEAGKGDDYHGYIRWDESKKELLTEIIRTANENGLLVQMHAIGEGAVRYALDCFEKAREGMEDKDYRNSIAHVTQIAEEDISRFAENKVAALLAPHWSPWIIPTKGEEISIYGEEKAKEMYRIKSFLNAGAMAAFHTDGMCAGGVPEMIYTAVTRKNPLFAAPHTLDSYVPRLTEIMPDEIRGENERLTGMESLKCLTGNAAYTMKEEDRWGCIRVGMSADLSIYNADFTNDAFDASIDCTKAALLSVFSSGKLVYPFEIN